MFRPALDTTKFAIVYPRQSTGEQVRENVYSLERQLALRDVALADGFADDRIIVVNDDLGMSGRRIEHRPGFMRALALIEQGAVAALYAEDQTRLSRDERTIDHMQIVAVCERGGTLIFAGGSWYDMRDSGQRQSFKYQAVGGSEYWKAHLAKVHAARSRKAERGQAAATLPRGYRPNRTVPRAHPERDKPVIHEPEAEVIRELVAQLREAGSIRELFRRTDAFRWPDGAAISYTHLSKLLRSPILRGTYVHGAITVPNNHPAIIAPDDAAMIDGLRDENRAIKRREAAGPAGVLAGLVWCPACASKFETSSGGRWPAYRCQGRAEAGHRGARRGGYHFGMAIAEVDAAVVADLWATLDAGLVDAIVAELRGSQRAAAKAASTTTAQAKAVERRVAGFLKSLADPDLPAVARRMIQAQLDEAGQQLEALQAAHTPSPRLGAELAEFEALQADEGFARLLPLTWDEEPIAWRRSWVRRFIRRIDLDSHGTLAIAYRGGVTRRLDLGRRELYDEHELAIIRAIYLDPDRPKRGWCERIRTELERAGFTRTRGAIYHATAAIRADG